MKSLKGGLGLLVVLVLVAVAAACSSEPTKEELTARAEKAERMSLLKTRAMNAFKEIRSAPSGDAAEKWHTTLEVALHDMGAAGIREIGTTEEEIGSLVCDAYYRDAQARLADLRALKADPDKAGQLEREFYRVQARSCRPLGTYVENKNVVSALVARNHIGAAAKGGAALSAADLRQQGVHLVADRRPVRRTLKPATKKAVVKKATARRTTPRTAKRGG